MTRMRGLREIIVLAWVAGWTTAAWAAAEVKVEAGSRNQPLTPQEIQAVSQAVTAIGGGREKFETKEGRLEAKLKVETLSADRLQELVNTLRQTGDPFELKVKGAALSDSDVSALRGQFAGQPVKVKVEAEKGVQEIEIETEHLKVEHEHPEMERRHRHSGEHSDLDEGMQHQRGEHSEIERSKPERSERMEKPEKLEEPEKPESHESHD